MNLKCIALGWMLAGMSTAAYSFETSMVRIIAFNDFHGNLLSPGNIALRKDEAGMQVPAGGVDFLAAYVKQLKSDFPNHVVVSAGDLTGASPLVSGAFHDEGAIETMNRLGLEFNAVGNHEFDDGKAELLRKQYGGCYPGGKIGLNTCLGAADENPVPVPAPFEGAKFKYLAANVVDNATGDSLFPAYGVKSFQTAEGGSIRVGFIGLTLQNTASIVSPNGVAGLSFKDEVQTVNALVPDLRKQGVEAIVVLLHQGGVQGASSPNTENDCALNSGGVADPAALQPLRNIVGGLDDAVDLVVSGHTHTAYTCLLPNSIGRMIPVTQADHYGLMLTSIDLTIDSSSGDVSGSSFHNTIVDRSNVEMIPDPDINKIIQAYHNKISVLASQGVGAISAPVLNAELTSQTTATGVTGEKPAGDLIADAMLAATRASTAGGAQMAFVNSGGVRADYADKALLPGYPYNVTYADAFTVQPFGNNLVTMTLTAQHLKDVLEMQFPGNNCVTPSGVNKQSAFRIMQPANGFFFSWRLGGADCHKIEDAILTTYNESGIEHIDAIVSGGVVNNPGQTYRITVNSFMANGGDEFSVFNLGNERLTGPVDIEATIAYLSRFKATDTVNSAYDPDATNLHKPRIIKLP